MIGYSHQSYDECIVGKVEQQLVGSDLGAAAAKCQYSTMNVETGDFVHDGLRSNVDRNMRWRSRQRLSHASQPGFEYENGEDFVTLRREQHVQDDLALGNEHALTSDEIALTDGVISFDARIIGVDDRNWLHMTCH